MEEITSCNDDDDFSSEDIDALYNLNNDTTLMASPESFHPGDHVWMWCETAGGVRYQHHGIVLYANNTNATQKTQKQALKIADFTAPNNGTFAIPDSVASGSTMNSNHRLPHWHGVRVTTYESVNEWQKEEYVGDNCADENVIVLQRVKFLLSNPHLIPKYDLLESNCETVAVWCKTGCFRTFQVAGMVDGGKRNSITVAASGVLASSLLGPLALPAIAGGALSFSALLLKENRNESIWMERTKILNDEFERWQEEQEQVCVIL